MYHPLKAGTVARPTLEKEALMQIPPFEKGLPKKGNRGISTFADSPAHWTNF
jgi:hypothetical protein